MGIYSYQQFEDAARQSGLWGQFSTADLALARKDPDAGMSILKYKTDYRSAATPEARALANMGAERVRSSYGNYMGGGDGGSFHLGPLSPGSFDYGKQAPSFGDTYQGDIRDLWDKRKGQGGYTWSGGPAPTYQSRHDAAVQELLRQLVDRPAFSYDADKDPLYAQYAKEYTREGDRAVKNALGQAMAANGGLASSSAATAASQAGDYHASRLTDKIPELYQLSYNKYMNDHAMKLGDLGAVQGAEAADYDKYLTRLGQYDRDRDFDRDTWRMNRDDGIRELEMALRLQGAEDDRVLHDRERYDRDRAFAYGQHMDEIRHQAGLRQEGLDLALRAADMGDFSFLRRMGIDTDRAGFREDLKTAQLAAQYGDYSRLRALGIEPRDERPQRGRGRPMGGGGGGPSPYMDYDGLFEAARSSGHPESYLANAYRDYGFRSSKGLMDEYRSWKEEREEQERLIRPGRDGALKGGLAALEEAAGKDGGVDRPLQGDTAEKTYRMNMLGLHGVTPELMEEMLYEGDIEQVRDANGGRTFRWTRQGMAAYKGGKYNRYR